MWVESMAGKSGALHGITHDSTSFIFGDEKPAADYFGTLLTKGKEALLFPSFSLLCIVQLVIITMGVRGCTVGLMGESLRLIYSLELFITKD